VPFRSLPFCGHHRLVDPRIVQVVEDFFDGCRGGLGEVRDGLGFQILPQLLLHSGVELAGRQGDGESTFRSASRKL
jgi:hypothetical protein